MLEELGEGLLQVLVEEKWENIPCLVMKALKEGGREEKILALGPVFEQGGARHRCWHGAAHCWHTPGRRCRKGAACCREQGRQMSTWTQ